MFPSAPARSLVSCLILLGVVACGAPPEMAEEEGPVTPEPADAVVEADSLPDIQAALMAVPDGQTFAALWALVDEGARPVVSMDEIGDGVTILVPTDDAFGALPAGTLGALRAPSNRVALRSLLRFHVLQGRYDQAALRDGDGALTTLSGEALTRTVVGSAVDLSGAILAAGDIPAKGAILHRIDALLLPPAPAD